MKNNYKEKQIVLSRAAFGFMMALKRGLSEEMLVDLVRAAGSKGALGAVVARFFDFVAAGSF